MTKNLRLALIFFLACAGSGCTELHYTFAPFRAGSVPIEDPPAGPPEFQQGFKDGCESGISGWGSVTEKTAHSWKQDPFLMKNPLYKQIWRDAYHYCRVYMEMAQDHMLGNFR